MIIQKEAIFAKIESTYGEDSVPIGANAIAVFGIQANPSAQARFTDRPILRAGSIGKASPLFGGALFELKFSVELKASGVDNDTPPEYGPLLRACGMQETINLNTSVVYKPRSSGLESVTIYYFQDGGLRYRVTGCRGTFNVRGAVGEVMSIEFTMLGRLTAGDPTNVSDLTPTLQSAVPPVFMANNFLSIGAYNPIFTEFTLDVQNSVVASPNANSSDGYGEISITERDVRGTINPQMTDKATQDWVGDMKAGTTRALTLQLGAAGGNRFAVAVPVMRYMEQSFDEREGKRTIAVNYKADETASLNDEFTITYT